MRLAYTDLGALAGADDTALQVASYRLAAMPPKVVIPRRDEQFLNQAIKIERMPQAEFDAYVKKLNPGAKAEIARVVAKYGNMVGDDGKLHGFDLEGLEGGFFKKLTKALTPIAKVVVPIVGGIYGGPLGAAAGSAAVNAMSSWAEGKGGVPGLPGTEKPNIPEGASQQELQAIFNALPARIKELLTWAMTNERSTEAVREANIRGMLPQSRQEMLMVIEAYKGLLGSDLPLTRATIARVGNAPQVKAKATPVAPAAPAGNPAFNALPQTEKTWLNLAKRAEALVEAQREQLVRSWTPAARDNIVRVANRYSNIMGTTYPLTRATIARVGTAPASGVVPTAPAGVTDGGGVSPVLLIGGLALGAMLLLRR
jgi:hypothetical protein